MKKSVKKLVKPSAKKAVLKMKQTPKMAKASSSPRSSVKATAKTAVKKMVKPKSKSKKIFSKKQTSVVDQVPMNQSPKAQEISAPLVSDTGGSVTSIIPTQVNSRPTSQQQFRNQSR